MQEAPETDETLRPSRSSALEGVIDWDYAYPIPPLAIWRAHAMRRTAIDPDAGQKSDNHLSCRSRVLLAVGVCSGRRSPASSPSLCWSWCGACSAAMG